MGQPGALTGSLEVPVELGIELPGPVQESSYQTHISAIIRFNLYAHKDCPRRHMKPPAFSGSLEVNPFLTLAPLLLLLLLRPLRLSPGLSSSPSKDEIKPVTLVTSSFGLGL